ncbi:MAG: hypothetical protein A4E36_00213 [Methanoregulaceae archaeon PtaB.Bin009]|nr:MAG: hypothetical protein A4E36_00213 [Methanoregulaceae archaeon PtaB.Bin009]
MGEESNVIGYEREIEAISRAIEQFDPSNPRHVAIIGEPMAGKTTVAGEIMRRYGDCIHSVTLGGVMTQDAMPAFSSIQKDCILVDNCEFFATRQIGGFKFLDDFLKCQFSSTKLFITAWNSYAWRYLSAVRNIGTYYPLVVTLPAMDSSTLKQVILSNYPQREIRFVENPPSEPASICTMVQRQARLPFSGREVSIPWFHLNTNAIRSQLQVGRKTVVSPEDAVFEKIRRIAQGNPGVAMQIFSGCLEDDAVSSEKIPEDECELSLDITESFVLTLILSMKSLHYRDFSAMAGGGDVLDRALFSMRRQGLIFEDDGVYRISPARLNCIGNYLKKTRRVW